jgi:hypothetical protein
MTSRWRVGTLAALLASAIAVGACSSTASTTAATTTTAPPPIATLTQTRDVSPLYSQGVARAANGWIFSGTNWLARTDDALHQTLIKTRVIPKAWTARGYDHIGDIDLIGNIVYAPFEEPDYTLGHQATAMYDATTFRFISAVVLNQHQNSFVAVDPKTMLAYSMDEFGGAALLRYDTKHAWKPLAPLKMSRFVDKVQGADVAGGAVWLSTDDSIKGLYRVDLASGHVDTLVSQGVPKGEGEGIDATPTSTGLLHALIVDPRLAPVYLHDYRVGPRPG